MGGTIALVLVLAVAACGGGGSTGTASSSSTESSQESYTPRVRLKCVEVLCGSNPVKNESIGWYYIAESNFPPNTPVVVTAVYPNGEPYPFEQYSSPDKLYGFKGNVEITNEHGELPKFKWAAFNENAPVDPPGKYRLTFHFKHSGELVAAHATVRMERIFQGEAGA
jgi:hypothetical protein